MTIERAKQIMGYNFVGPEELKNIQALSFRINIEIPSINYTEEQLESSKDDYVLILGVSKFDDGKDVSIRNLKAILGKDPEISEPCFYNQDWYDQEAFIDIPMQDEWFLIRKNVYEESRAVMPEVLTRTLSFPSAIRCVYSFFAIWYTNHEMLWYHDFVWCSDVDHNGDRIYVGKYHDVDGVNKNGFSIHRHLSLRKCYTGIDTI